jgi:hypothetical protein
MPEHYDLKTFTGRRFDYRPGHHVGIFGPTQIAGKSTLAFALAGQVIRVYPEIRPVVLNMKHQDRVVAGWTRRLGFQETPSWPPQRRLSQWNPAGYTLWPPQTLTDVEADNARLRAEFIKAIVANRKRTPSLTMANELYGLLAELNLRQLLTAVVTRDSIAGHGLMYESQKPSGTQGISIPGFFFNCAEHMFLAKDGEERNRVRYGEIACGIDPRDIERETLRLAPFSWLYIRRSGPQWAIVDAYDPALAIPAA